MPAVGTHSDGHSGSSATLYSLEDAALLHVYSKHLLDPENIEKIKSLPNSSLSWKHHTISSSKPDDLLSLYDKLIVSLFIEIGRCALFHCRERCVF
jgi:hypothetical protein